MKSRLLGLGLLLFMVSCRTKVFKNELPQILGVNNVEIEKSQDIDVFGGFGEGYTLEVYKLSEKVVQAFINKASKDLPYKREDTIMWEKYGWNKAPFDSLYSEIAVMALNYSSGNNRLDVQLNAIKQAFKKGRVYYSFYYRPTKENPEDVQFFVLDVQSRKLYAIDSSI